jgi:hypothetical protein
MHGRRGGQQAALAPSGVITNVGDRSSPGRRVQIRKTVAARLDSLLRHADTADAAKDTRCGSIRPEHKGSLLMQHGTDVSGGDNPRINGAQ